MAGVITTEEMFSDRGSFKLNIDKSVCDEGVRCEYFNALGPYGKPSEYGDVNTEEALAVSSDSYFYRIGELMHERTADHNLLGDELRLFGFGAESGIDLPFEFDGRIPTAALKKELIEKKVLLKGESPNLLLGDNVQLAIGQGLLASSPLQLANAYSTLANGGFLYRPHIIKAIFESGTPDGFPGYVDVAKAEVNTSYEKPEIMHQIEMPHDVVLPIVKGLDAGDHWPGHELPGDLLPRHDGRVTCSSSYPCDEMPIVGKTGTAQGSESKPWFDSSVFGRVQPRSDAALYRGGVPGEGRLRQQGRGAGREVHVRRCNPPGGPGHAGGGRSLADPLDETIDLPGTGQPLVRPVVPGQSVRHDRRDDSGLMATDGLLRAQPPARLRSRQRPVQPGRSEPQRRLDPDDRAVGAGGHRLYDRVRRRRGRRASICPTGTPFATAR